MSEKSSNLEIERLKQRMNEAFHRKTEACKVCAELKAERDGKRQEMDELWSEVGRKRDARDRAKLVQQAAWDEYKSQKRCYSDQIDEVSREAREAHEAMVEAFKMAHDAYESGDGESAAAHASDGHSFKAEREYCNQQKKNLIEESKAIARPDDIVSMHEEEYGEAIEKHRAAKEEYKDAKKRFREACEESKRLNEEFISAKSDFDIAVAHEKTKWHAETCLRCNAIIWVHEDWEKPFNYCETCREYLQRNRKNAQETVGQEGILKMGSFSYDAKVVPSKDYPNETDVYFGGAYEPDGKNHGHMRYTNVDNSVSVLRMPGKKKRHSKVGIDYRRDNPDHTNY